MNAFLGSTHPHLLMHILVGLMQELFPVSKLSVSARDTGVELRVSGQYVKIHFSVPKYKQNKMLIHFDVIEFFRS